MSRRVIGEVRLDSRGRVNLGPECGNKLYLAYQEHDGTIVLQPAKIAPLKHIVAAYPSRPAPPHKPAPPRGETKVVEL